MSKKIDGLQEEVDTLRKQAKVKSTPPSVSIPPKPQPTSTVDDFKCKCPAVHGKEHRCHREVKTVIKDGKRVKKWEDDNLCALCYTAGEIVKELYQRPHTSPLIIFELFVRGLFGDGPSIHFYDVLYILNQIDASIDWIELIVDFEDILQHGDRG